MKTYTRKNNIIKTFEDGRVVETQKFESIAKAKKASCKLQKDTKGCLGNGVVTVISGKQFSPSSQKALWRK